MRYRAVVDVLGHLQHLALADVPCAELLERFRASSQVSVDSDKLAAEAAFAELTRRHGPKVYAICRRILGDSHLAEDAFQATFIILFRKAATIRPASAVGGFLYGVARKAALEALRVSRRRKDKVVDRMPEPALRHVAPAELDELAMLDEEIANLSAAHRAAVVLCEIDGVSRARAARLLGISEGTLSSRLAAARTRLRRQLTKRGVSFSAGMIVALSESARAALPLQLTGIVASMTVEAPVRSVAQIVERVMRGMLLAKLRLPALLLTAIVLAAGAGLHFSPAGEGPGKPHVNEPKVEKVQAPVVDIHGDPRPARAAARLGTLRQRAADSHLAMSPDGKEIVTVGRNMTVRVWDAASGQLRSVNQLPLDWADKTTLSADGKFLACDTVQPDHGHCLIVWDVALRKIIHTHSLGENCLIDGMSFSATGRQIAIADGDNPENLYHIRVLDLDTGRIRTLIDYKTPEPGRRYYFAAAQFSPDGKHLIAFQRDRAVTCWDLATDKLAWEKRPAGFTPFFCISPDSKIVLLPASEPLEIATGKQVPWKGKPPPGVPLRFSPDGRRLTLANQGTVLIWDLVAEKKTLELRQANHGHELTNSNSDLNVVAFAPDSASFLWRSDTIQRWNLDNGQPVYPDTRSWGHTEAITRLQYSPDGAVLASSGKDQIFLWNIADCRPLLSIPGTFNQLMAFSPNGQQFFARHSQEHSGVGRWDLPSGKLTKFLEWKVDNELFGFSSDKEMRVSSDGKTLTVLSWKNGRRDDECLLTVWNLLTGERTRMERVPWGEESALTPDGESVVAIDDPSRRIVCYSLETAKPRWQEPLKPRSRNNWPMYDRELAISKNGRLVAAHVKFVDFTSNATDWEGIRILDSATGRQLMKWDVDAKAVFAFSPDDRLFAVATAEGVRFWEIASRKLVGFIAAPNRNAIPPGQPFATALAFSPDSRTLATGHLDTTILLWDATFRDHAQRGPLSDAERDSLWTELAEADAKAANVALWRFIDDPKATLEYLKKRIPSLRAAPDELVAPLLRDLDSADFKLRSAAEKKLEQLADRAEPALRRSLETNLPLEAKRRIESILSALDPSIPLSKERLRGVRVLCILEQIASPESRQLVNEISRGDYASDLKNAASDVAKRMRLP